jgi:hypothetical protein
MNSPLYYDPYHHHDPTIISVHTLLKPQPYQQYTQQHPSYYPPSSITHISSHTSPTSFLQQHHTPPISTIEIGSLINQLLQSQEEFKHTLSVFANEVSLLKTTLTPTFNHNQPHQELTHTIKPFTQHHPPFPSFNNTHQQTFVSPSIPTYTSTEASPSSIVSSLNLIHQNHTPPPTYESQQTIHTPSYFSHINTHTNILVATKPEISNFKNHDTTFSVMADFSAVETGEKFDEFIASEESSVTTQLNEEAATPILQNTVTNEIVEDNDFTISKTEQKWEKETMRFTPDSLIRSCSYFKKSLFTTNTSSSEKKVVRAITPQQHMHLTFELSDVSIHIFDPGGTLIVAVCAAERRRQIQNFRSNIPFFSLTTTSSLSHHVFASLFSLLWLPWDKGKLEVLSFWSPTTIDGDNRHILSLLWLPRDRGKFKVWIGLRLSLGLGLGLESSKKKKRA